MACRRHGISRHDTLAKQTVLNGGFDSYGGQPGPALVGEPVGGGPQVSSPTVRGAQ